MPLLVKSFLRKEVLAPLILTISALALRLWRVEYPGEMIFDEVYYLEAARAYISGKEDPNWVQPPLGKIFIALSMVLFGDNALGWRFMSALFGALTVFLTYELALKSFGSYWSGVFSGYMVSLDYLHYVQSRIAMLDTQLTFFGLLGLYLFTRHMDSKGRIRALSPYLIFSGIAFGLALATKLPALLAIIAATITYLYLYFKRGLGRISVAFFLLFMIALPLTIYLASYIQYLLQRGSLLAWFDLQLAITNFNLGLKATHPYASQAWSWIAAPQPLPYFLSSGGLKIEAKANILVWWAGLGAMVLAGYRAIVKREQGQAFVVLAFLAQYLPWFFLPRVTFIYYMVPALPFLYLPLAYFLAFYLLRHRIGISLLLAYLVGIGITFSLSYPSLAALSS